MNGFIESLKARIFNSARNISSGDIKIQSFQAFKADWNIEIDKALSKNYITCDMMSFPNMVQNEKGDSFLVNVKAVDDKYPLYGEIKLQNQNFSGLKSGEALLAKESIERFHIKVGDFILLGSEKLKIIGVIEELPDQGFTGSSAFNPIMLVRLENAMASGLIQFGSRVSYIKAFKNIKKDSIEKIEKDAEVLESKLISEPLQITTWKETQNNSTAIFNQLSSFFNILAYTALMLASLGFYLGVTYFVLKLNKEVAVIYGFGVSKKIIYQSLMSFFFVIVLFGCLIGLSIGLFCENFLVQQMEEVVVVKKDFSIHPALVNFTLLFTFISSGIVICFCLNQFIQKLAPSQYNISFSQNYFSLKGFLIYIFTIFFLLICFSWYQTGIFITSIGIIGMILFMLLMLFGFVFALITFFRVIVKPLHNSPLVFIAGIEFFKNKTQHLPSLIGLILSSVLVLGINSTSHNINQKLTLSNQKDIPNVFMIDIQKSQLPEIVQMQNSNSHFSHFNYSPLIRARLVHINQVPVEKLKEEAKIKNKIKKSGFLSRSYNLTYKDKLNDSEKVVQGKFWEIGYDGPGISLEEDFAQSMNLKLGDTIGFDLAGLQIDGKVTSIRSIDWSSMLPNFFVIFPEKKLENAPQFIIGSAKIDENSLSSFQNNMASLFPNISIIDVSVIFKKIQRLFEKVKKVLDVSTILCICATIAIMASALFTGEEDLERRNFYLRSIGMNTRQILLVSFYEKLFFLISLVCSVAVLLIIWNLLLGLWLNENISFQLGVFSIYLGIIGLLVFLPMAIKRSIPGSTSIYSV